MIKDGKLVENNEILEADICIIGGGTAGISMALQFINEKQKVILLESGSTEQEQRTKNLAKGKNLGTSYYNLDDSRPRYFGGGSNLWAGWCRPFDPIDFEKREWVPYSGWPLSKKDLDPYYIKAEELCEIPNKSFEASDWKSSASELYKHPYINKDIPATVWVGSPPTKFGKVYRNDLENAKNLEVYLNANVTELITNDLGSLITSVKVASYAGNKFEVHSKIFVLLSGAIEAARLLLASKQGSIQGIGNENDNVGRFFMEHPHVVTSHIQLFNKKNTKRNTIPALDYRMLKGAKARLSLERPKNGVKFAYTTSEDLQRKHKLLNYSAHLRTISPVRNPKSLKSMKLIVSNFRSVKGFYNQVKKGTLPDGLGKQLKNVFFNPDDVVRLIYNQVLSVPKVLELFTQSEQVPNPNSRVILSNDVDEFGVPNANLDWRFSSIDKTSIKKSQEIIGEQFEKVGIGKLISEPWVLDDDPNNWDPSMIGGYHHLGTTRMGTNPQESVVDENCKVFSVENLYVTGTSAFTTGGYANPLLTGLALTLRTADHIKEKIIKKKNLHLVS